ncbi:MAG: lytic transglycosylase domain-containing protein, partial [Desulfofustis sp.]|nr:lytic transglycosylase domain-containing protein [Desulfofustis sp.]
GWQPETRAAAIYICQEENGNKHFTNLPESGNCVPFSRNQPASFSARPVFNGLGAHNAYDQYIDQYGKRYKIDPNLIKAVIRAESDFNRHAVSGRGAQGLMQLMPETARELNVSDPFNPDQNIDGGTRYLRYLLQTFEGDLTLALAAYNAGPSLVKRVQRVPRIPETVQYVKRVLAYYQGYGRGQVVDAFDRSSIRVGGLVTVQ